MAGKNMITSELFAHYWSPY